VPLHKPCNGGSGPTCCLAGRLGRGFRRAGLSPRSDRRLSGSRQRRTGLRQRRSRFSDAV